MERNELHQQILELADKIGHLNDTLSRSKKVHPVEIDLLRLYVRELVAGTEELAEMAGVPKVQTNIQQPTIEAPTITEPVNLEELAAKVPEKAPAPPSVAPKATVIEPVATPSPPPIAEPVVQKPVDPVAPKIVEPKVEQQVAPVAPPRVEPVVIEKPKEANPIFEPVFSTPESEALNEIVDELPTAKNQSATTEEPPHTPPLRRQVNLQPDSSGAENKFVAPVAGTAVRALHSIEEEPEAPSINDRFAQQSDLFQNTKRIEGKGLKEMMDLGERFLFIKELFAGDLAAFERATNAMDGIANMDQARAYMEGVLRQTYNWEGKEPVVRQLYNLLEQRFKA